MYFSRDAHHQEEGAVDDTGNHTQAIQRTEWNSNVSSTEVYLAFFTFAISH